ncbi:Sec-independent protein translocase protein TatA [Candidatus Bealeia paramacronuclearis]|uniref:Sec-independent protein translocase protein TatA n=1 Tax=Candidatus Bealeia paramacronuclearis TaxID=1921001 RepID=A0ABZ2C446_9PROT|nr:Sec-independent protein translocase protein TatA [Candidatus Bealeia paramacronuclearis]
MGLSFSHVLLVLVVILIVFGAGKLPSVMADLAKGMRAFRDGMKEGGEEDKPQTLIESPKKDKP